ncbi:MAG TPA: long-chain fatty acid--CoA ligase [Acidobacteriota bacterium]|nr:long-chain fatty acid--CoA ligase [Acidobacteriota bacterium]
MSKTVEKIWQRFYDEQVPLSVDYPNISLYEMFKAAVKDNPDGTATIFFGAKTSYRKIDSQVNQFASALASKGVAKGDRVALILPNMPGYVIAHFAVLRLGAVLVPTNPLYVERELSYQLNNSGAETVVILDQLYPKLKRVRKDTSVRTVVVMSVADFLPFPLNYLYRFKNKTLIENAPQDGVYPYSSFMKGAASEREAAVVDPSDTAILLYTGGTTGVSKGAELTHRNVVVNAYQTRAWLWSIDEGREVLLCVLPFFHSYGMTTGMHLSVVARSTMLLLPRFELADVAKNIKKYRPTIFCGVPSMYNAINRYPKLTPEDVSSIRLCISGGAALPAEVQARFEERTGGKLVEGYGLTECSPVALVNPTHGHRKNGTIGVPISDTEAKIADPATGEELPIGEVGELALKGPQVMKGYWNMPEETRNVLRDNWLFTGDMAVCDKEGFFRIVDRKKDVIISAGMNVYPREVEEVLHQHPKIVEAAVVGEASSVREEVVKAYVVVEEGAMLTKAEVVEFCRDKLSKFKIPRKIEFVDELPKSAMGKVLKRVLKEEVE